MLQRHMSIRSPAGANWGDEPMTKLEGYPMLNVFDRLRGVPAFVGAVCLLLSGDSILGRLSILAAETELELTSHQSALNAVVEIGRAHV